jgi:hypothetical protein
MRRFLLGAIVTVISLAGCHSPQHPAGRFYNGFSMADSVKRMNIPELTPMTAGAGRSSSPGAPTRYAEVFEQEHTIHEPPDARFDEAAFMQKLRTAVS